MLINKQYIIFIWIILLIIFTFYCIFRIKYINEKYYDIPLTNPTQPSNVFSYIKNIQTHNKITDIPSCENVYDDNIGINDLGYNSCKLAYTDYFNKNYDVNNKYGMKKSLADICPVTAKTEKYNTCLNFLLNKFTDSNTILDNINNDMNTSINKRIQDRSNILNDTLHSNSIKTFLFNKEQIDFNNNLVLNGQITNYPDERLGLVNNYYKNKYISYSENFTNLIDSFIEKKYFGNYIPVKGQFIAINDLILSISYNISSEVSNTIMPNNILPTFESSNTNMPTTTMATTDTTTTAPSNTIMSSTDSSILPSESNIKAINLTTKPVIFTIQNDDLTIVYDIVNIDYYNTKKAIKLILNNKQIVKQNNINNTNELLLSTLGLYDITEIIIVENTFKSTEGIIHTTYKLVNDKLSTILILTKLT